MFIVMLFVPLIMVLLAVPLGIALFAYFISPYGPPTAIGIAIIFIMYMMWRKRMDTIWRNASLVPCKAEVYFEWLREWVNAGNEPTHDYNWKLDDGEFYHSNHDVVIQPAHGTSSKNLVVEKACSVIAEGHSHNSIFFWDQGGNPVTIGIGVPIYSNFGGDITEEAISLIQEFRKVKAKRRSGFRVDKYGYY